MTGRPAGLLILAMLVLTMLIGRAVSAAAWAAETAPAAGPAPSDASAPNVAMRGGAHAGYGRLVFDLPVGETGLMTQDRNTLALRFTVPGIPAVPAILPPNVQAIHAAQGQVDITLAPGVRVRRTRLGNRLVIDLLDASAPDPPRPDADPQASAGPPAPVAPVSPAASAPARPSVAASTAPPAREPSSRRLPRHRDILASKPEAGDPSVGAPPARPAAGPSSARMAAPAASPAPPAREMPSETGSPAPVEPVVAAPLPPSVAAGAGAGAVALAADAVLPNGAAPAGSRPAGASAETTMRLPFDAQAGAAAFRLGDEAYLVFDERRPIDTARLRDDPKFAGLTVQLLQGGTLVRLPLAPGRAVMLSRSPGAWDASVIATPADAEPIRPVFGAGEMHLAAASPGHVLSVPNPQTGGVLLVGTQLAPGQAVAVARRNPMLTLLPTWQGVAVDPAIDALAMRTDKDGFVVAGDAPGRPLALAPGDAAAGAMADAAKLTRRFDFPAQSDQALQWRLRAAMAQAASTPLQSRTRARVQVAQAMLALGLGAEAQGVLSLAATDDPQGAADPDLVGLSAVAALLAGRVAEADGLDNPALSGSDEIALWRAIRTAARNPAGDPAGEPSRAAGAAAAAPILSAEVKLLLAYPRPLLERLLPLAAETMALGGEAAAAQRLVDGQADDRSLDLARAMLADAAARRGGDPAPALAIYDRLAVGRDRLTRLRAASSAIDLRLAAGQVSAGQAADSVDRLLVSWRGDGREIALRFREAELRGQAGEWRRGLALLRETLQGWPEQKDQITSRMSALFAAALADDRDHPLAPLELITLAEENPDLMPAGEPGRALAARLADRLAALDLPSRAIPALAHLMGATPAGPARAELGGRLAAWQLRNGDAKAALATLDGSESADVPADLAETRGLLRARVDAAGEDLPGALAVLDHIDSPGADDVRATLLEAAKDWPAATAALSRYAERVMPADGVFDAEQARIMLRLASAAAQAADETTLSQLREQDVARMPPGDTARLFAMLTEAPVSGIGDLQRAAQETTLARTLPEALKGLRPPSFQATPPAPPVKPAPGPRPMAAR